VNEYLASVDALSEELDSIAEILASLRSDEWSRPTLLVPVERVPNWTVLELAAHLGYAMDMVETLLSEQSASPPALDRTSFYDHPRGSLAPLAYRTAADVADSKTHAEILDFCLKSFANALETARRTDPAFVGWTVIGTIRVDDFIATRVVEAVVHGFDLTQALDRTATPSAWAVDCAASVMDTLNQRRHGRSRPESLADNWFWVQVASGRRRHGGFPTPLLS